MKNIFTILMLFIALKSFCQQDVIADLSNEKIDNKKVISGSVRLILLYTLPKKFKKIYEVKSFINNTLPQPISLPQQSDDTKGGEVNFLGEQCGQQGYNIGVRINTIESHSSTEKELGDNFNNIQKLIKDSLKDECQDSAQKLLDSKKESYKQLSYLESLKENQEVVVTIERKSEDGKIEKIWEFTITTPSKPDKWLIHYGFTYQPNIIRKYDQFFSKAVTWTTDSYTITKSNANTRLYWQNVSPTLAFSHPLSKSYHDLMPAFTFITGTNFSTYSAGAGLSGIIAYNGLISCDVMYTQKYALNGQYKEGDVIKENLNFDQ